MEFGKKLRCMRKQEGISQQTLADRIFVSRSAVAKWENGLGLPSEESLLALAEYFGIPEDDLKTDRPEMAVIQKNRTIRKLSGSVLALLAAAAAAVVLYALLHPVPYYASARWDRIHVQTVSQQAEGLEITDQDAVRALIDHLNAVSFRRALRLSHEAPDHLRAVFYVRDGTGAGHDIWLCGMSDDSFSVYVWDGRRLLAARNAAPLREFLLQLTNGSNHSAGQTA